MKMKIVLFLLGSIKTENCQPIEDFTCNPELNVNVRGELSLRLGNDKIMFLHESYLLSISVNTSCIEERHLTGYYVLLNGKKCETCLNDNFIFDLDDNSQNDVSDSSRVKISTEITLRKGSHGILLGGLDLGEITCIYKKTISVAVDYSSKLTNGTDSLLVTDTIQPQPKSLYKYERIGEDFDSPFRVISKSATDETLLLEETSSSHINYLCTTLAYLVLFLH